MLRILIVDDDPGVLATLEVTLKGDYEVVSASNGLDALEKLEKVEPDIVIMDVAMPCLNGFDTAMSIRKNQRFRDMPIIFLTGSDDMESREMGQGLGAVFYMTKPFSPSQLRDDIARHVEEASITPREKAHTVDRILSADREGVELTPFDIPGSEIDTDIATDPSSALVKARILVVDDEPDIVFLIESFLSHRYEIVTATHSLEALERIVEVEPDLLLLDIEMPSLSGYQLSQLLKLNRNLAQIKIMFVSSRDQPDEIEYGYRLGAVGYLTKPFTPDALENRVREIVEHPEFRVRSKKHPVAHFKRSTSF